MTHPSQPNYPALFYGSTQGVSGSSPPLEFSSSLLTLAGAGGEGADLWRLWGNRRRSWAYAMGGFCRLGGRRTELQRVSRHRRWLRRPADRFLHYAERPRQHDGHDSVPDVGSRQQLPADHRVHAESSRDDRGWRGDPGSGVEQSTGQRMHALATTENLYGLTPFGESAGATVLDFTSATPLTAASSVVAARLRDL